MNRLVPLAVTLGIALAVPAAPLVLAQAQKAVTTVTVTGDEKKAAGDAKKAAAPAQKAETKTVEIKAADGKVIEKRVMVDIKVARPAAPVGAVVVQKVAGVAANLEPQVRQFIQQFRPAMRAEYYFVRTACAPAPDQRAAIAREGEKALREVAKAYAEVQMRPVQIRNGRAVYPDPRRMIEEAMARAVKPRLTPEQAARYQAELDRRAADRREAAARNIVAKVDQDLLLSPGQREKIGEAVLARWDDSWCQSLETLLYGDQFYPKLPDDVVSPHLDERQRRIWHASQQNQSFFFGFVGNMLPNEDAEDDKELIEARKEAEKDQPQQGAAVEKMAAPANAIIRRVAPAAPAPPAAVKAVPKK